MIRRNMGRKNKGVIAVNKVTGERKYYDSVIDCSRDFSVSSAAIIVAVARGTSVKGWKMFDTPENIRIRIKELEEQIKMLEEEAD